MKPYSVLLLYPRSLSDDEPQTYYAHVWGDAPAGAVTAAKAEAMAVNEWDERDIAGGDFVPLLVTLGHHHGEALPE